MFFSENAGRQTRGQYHVWDTSIKLLVRDDPEIPETTQAIFSSLSWPPEFHGFCSLVLSLLLFLSLFFSLLHSLSLMVRAFCWRHHTTHVVKEYKEIKLVLTANLSPCWLALIALEDAIYAGEGVKCYPHSYPSMKPMNYSNYQYGKICHNSNRSTHILG